MCRSTQAVWVMALISIQVEGGEGPGTCRLNQGFSAPDRRAHHFDRVSSTEKRQEWKKCGTARKGQREQAPMQREQVHRWNGIILFSQTPFPQSSAQSLVKLRLRALDWRLFVSIITLFGLGHGIRCAARGRFFVRIETTC